MTVLHAVIGQPLYYVLEGQEHREIVRFSSDVICLWGP